LFYSEYADDREAGIMEVFFKSIYTATDSLYQSLCNINEPYFEQEDGELKWEMQGDTMAIDDDDDSPLVNLAADFLPWEYPHRYRNIGSSCQT